MKSTISERKPIWEFPSDLVINKYKVEDCPKIITEDMILRAYKERKARKVFGLN